MPELPEVETYVRELGPQLLGRQIAGTEVFWPRTIAEPDSGVFGQKARGLRFTGFGRRGKYMLFGLAESETGTDFGSPDSANALDGQTQGSIEQGSIQQGQIQWQGEPGVWTLIVHLRMTGKLMLVADSRAVDKHTHVVMTLEPGETGDSEQLVFVDSRKFGRIWLTAEPARVLAKLGPEPLSDAFSPESLGHKLQGRRAPIKALLLDQAVVAGVGNIYADEALFRAAIHPIRAGDSLQPVELEKLHAAVCAVLAEGIARQGSSLGGSSLQNYVRPSGEPGGFQEEHRVFRRTGLACHVCETSIERMVIAQRSTHFCPVCQPLPPTRRRSRPKKT